MKNRTLWSIALVLVAGGGLMLAGATVIGCDKPQEPAQHEGDSHGDHDAVEKLAVVNSKCPIMPANSVDSKSVPANLVRTFKGQKVGFCCGGCPPVWDKLTDEQREKKLAAAR